MGKDKVSNFDMQAEYALLTESLANKYAFNDKSLDDTNVVLMASSMIDKMLQFILLLKLFKHTPSKAEFEEVFEGNGPLSTFSSKISLASALRLTSPEARHDLKVIKKIRNTYAHSTKKLFLADMPQCLNLKGNNGEPVDADTPERKRFLEASKSAISELSVMACIVMAEISYINPRRQEIGAMAEEMINWLYGGGVGPKPTWLSE